MASFRGLCLVAAMEKSFNLQTECEPVKCQSQIVITYHEDYMSQRRNCLRLYEREVFPSLRLVRKGDLKIMKGFCSKPPESSKAPSQTSELYRSRVPLHKPTPWEKKIIIWSGRFKREEEIPETISFEMLDAAKNRVRVKISYMMIALTILGCVIMVFQGKQAVKRQETLTSLNLERKARLRREAEEALESKTD